jgi:hypothetical protein
LDDRGEKADCGADVIVEFVGSVIGAAAWYERQPVVVLAETVSCRSAERWLRNSQAYACFPISVEVEQSSEPEQSESAGPELPISIEGPGRALVGLEGAIYAEIARAVLESLQG